MVLIHKPKCLTWDILCPYSCCYIVVYFMLCNNISVVCSCVFFMDPHSKCSWFCTFNVKSYPTPNYKTTPPICTIVANSM